MDKVYTEEKYAELTLKTSKLGVRSFAIIIIGRSYGLRVRGHDITSKI